MGTAVHGASIVASHTPVNRSREAFCKPGAWVLAHSSSESCESAMAALLVGSDVSGSTLMGR